MLKSIFNKFSIVSGDTFLIDPEPTLIEYVTGP